MINSKESYGSIEMATTFYENTCRAICRAIIHMPLGMQTEHCTPFDINSCVAWLDNDRPLGLDVSSA